MCRESGQADEALPTSLYGIKVWKCGHCSQSDLVDLSDMLVALVLISAAVKPVMFYMHKVHVHYTHMYIIMVLCFTGRDCQHLISN